MRQSKNQEFCSPGTSFHEGPRCPTGLLIALEAQVSAAEATFALNSPPTQDYKGQKESSIAVY
jgi:hypothetical protein